MTNRQRRDRGGARSNPAVCRRSRGRVKDRSGALVHTLRADEAHFVISGIGAGPVYDLRWASNSSPITVHQHRDGWVVDSFVIEHVDRDGESWTIVVPATTWN